MKSKVQLKEEMQTTGDLAGVVEVMKEVAVTHLRHLEKHQIRFEMFHRALQEFFGCMAVKEVHHPFFEGKAEARLTVLITSDAGLLGGLNTAVVSEGLEGFDPQRKDGVAVIGERGKHLVRDALRRPPEGVFPGISSAIGREEIHAVRQWVVERVLEGVYGSVSVVYPHYYSITRQGVRRLQLFPCRTIPGETAVPPDRPPAPAISLEDRFYLESPLEEMVAFLVEQWTSERFYTLFWHSKLSELAARTLHMEESQQELSAEKKRLAYAYSKAVREEMDRNIREIVSAHSVKGGG